MSAPALRFRKAVQVRKEEYKTMRKTFEVSDPNSCLNRAQNNELIFVLISRDAAAASTIRYWCQLRILMGKNKQEDIQIQEALNMATMMERER